MSLVTRSTVLDRIGPDYFLSFTVLTSCVAYCIPGTVWSSVHRRYRHHQLPKLNFRVGLPLWFSQARIYLQCRRPGFNPWVRKIPWRREKLPTPVSWPGEFHGLYSPWDHKESDVAEGLSLSYFHIYLTMGCMVSTQPILMEWRN